MSDVKWQPFSFQSGENWEEARLLNTFKLQGIRYKGYTVFPTLKLSNSRTLQSIRYDEEVSAFAETLLPGQTLQEYSANCTSLYKLLFVFREVVLQLIYLWEDHGVIVVDRQTKNIMIDDTQGLENLKIYQIDLEDVIFAMEGDSKSITFTSEEIIDLVFRSPYTNELLTSFLNTLKDTSSYIDGMFYKKFLSELSMVAQSIGFSLKEILGMIDNVLEI